MFRIIGNYLNEAKVVTDISTLMYPGSLGQGTIRGGKAKAFSLILSETVTSKSSSIL